MENNRLHIGSKAPDFVANTTMGSLKMSDYKGKWVILFSHPGDFTPVCTTEFIAFAKTNDEFAQRNTQLIGLSIDSNPSHLAWLYTIYRITGITIPFPVIADRTGEISKLYEMIAPDVSNQETVRNVYFIDPEQVIRAILIYPMTNGRNIEEILRLLTALQNSDEHKVVTPANWQPGQPAMILPPQTYDQLIERKQKPQDLGVECKDWFWCYRTDPQTLNSQSKDSDKILSASQNTPSKYNLEEVTLTVEDLVKRLKSIRPVGTRQEQYNQFLTIHWEIKRLDDIIDLLEDQMKADYHAGNITWEEFSNVDHILDYLDNFLDHAENVLKQIFIMDN